MTRSMVDEPAGSVRGELANRIAELEWELQNEREARISTEAGAAVLRSALELLTQEHVENCRPEGTDCDHYGRAAAALRSSTAGDVLLEAARSCRQALDVSIPRLEDWAEATGRGKLHARDQTAIDQMKSALAMLKRVW